MTTAVIGLFGLFALWAAAVWLTHVFEHKLLYWPDRARVAPASVGLADVEERIQIAPDGARLITWRASPSRSSAPTILYFHGNARNLARRAGYFWLFRQEGWGLAALSYRGFGGSQGRPSEADNVADALQLYDTLIAEGVSPESIVVYGESIGSGVATQLAAQRPVAALVVHAPYDAVEEIAAWRAPYVLPRRFLRDRYRSIDHIPNVRAPILWLHGDRDGVIPIRFGHRLFAAATAPKTAAIVRGAGHFDLYAPNVFAAHFKPFVEALFGPSDAAVPPARALKAREPA